MAEQRMTHEELLALYDKQQAELKAATARVAELEESKKRQNTLSFKVVPRGEDTGKVDKEGNKILGKGTMSMYGLGRFPVSLYRTQWLKVIEAVKNGTIESELEKNKAKLADRE